MEERINGTLTSGKSVKKLAGTSVQYILHNLAKSDPG
jgi:hypothetical protein